jgi:hypothetical protein
VEAVDKLVERLEQKSGNATELLMAVVDSVPFQKARRQPPEAANEAARISRQKLSAGSGGSP